MTERYTLSANGSWGGGIPESVMQTSTLLITQEKVWELGRKEEEQE